MSTILYLYTQFYIIYITENGAYNHKIVSILCKTEINYYKHIFSGSYNKTNMKRTWSLINGLMSKNFSHSKVKNK